MFVSSAILLLLAFNGALLLAVFLMFIRIEHHLDRIERKRTKTATKSGRRNARPKSRGE